MTATAQHTVNLKRWFKKQFNIPVRVERASRVHILPNKTENHRDPITYSHQFPWDLGKRALQLTYPDSPTLHEHWCGNVHSNYIVLRPAQWAIIAKAQASATSKGDIDDIRPADRFAN